MFDIKFSANGEIFTYTSMGFANEFQLKQYFFEQYVSKYFKNDTIEILNIVRY